MNKWTYRLISILGLLVLFLAYQIIMEDDLKVYSPTVISESPFPNQDGDQSSILSDSSAGSGASKPSTNTKVGPRGLPKKVIAYETIGSALNTKSKKVLGAFDLVDQGAFRVGRYENGIQGELDFTPQGITAINKDGNVVLGFDVDTGSATFLGEIRAADFIVADELGLISLNNFNSDFVDNFNLQTIVPGGSYTEVSVSSGGGDPLVVEFDLARTSNVYIYCAASGLNETAGGFQLMAIFRDNGDGAPFTQMTGNLRISGAINDAAGSMQATTVSVGKIVTLESGHHRLALRHRATGSQQVQITDMTLGFMVLGR